MSTTTYHDGALRLDPWSDWYIANYLSDLSKKMLLRLALARLPMQSVLRIPKMIASPISGMEWSIWQTFEHVHCTVQICIKRRRWRNWWSWRRTIKLMTAVAWCMVTTQLHAPEQREKTPNYHNITAWHHKITAQRHDTTLGPTLSWNFHTAWVYHYFTAHSDIWRE